MGNFYGKFSVIGFLFNLKFLLFIYLNNAIGAIILCLFTKKVGGINWEKSRMLYIVLFGALCFCFSASYMVSLCVFDLLVLQSIREEAP